MHPRYYFLYKKNQWNVDKLHLRVHALYIACHKRKIASTRCILCPGYKLLGQIVLFLVNIWHLHVLVPTIDSSENGTPWSRLYLIRN